MVQIVPIFVICYRFKQQTNFSSHSLLILQQTSPPFSTFLSHSGLTPNFQILIKEYIYIMQKEQLPPPKSSFCRFYLRGLCVLTAKDCPFAHGVWDLLYLPWQGEEVAYDYHKTKDEQQKNTIKGPRIYTVLYEFQEQKIFTLEQLNTEKPARSMVRTLLHQRLYDEFVQLLEATYPGEPLTETLLHREFNRVGFNKILMAGVKFSQIAGYLCDSPPHSKYYRSTLEKQNILVRRAPLEEILEAYRKFFMEMMAGNEIDESALKKKIYTAKMPPGIPPINALLKELKLTIPELLSERLGIKGGKMIAECSVETVTELASKFLKEALPKRAVDWQDVFQYLSKSLKSNNGNLINQAKPHLVLQGHAFLSFPMYQLIYHPQIPTPFPREQCLCPYQTPYPKEQLPLSPLQKCQPLIQGQSYDIFNYQTLDRCAAHILNSSVLGVDLEGRLRRGGFVQMVQLNNGRNTFLFDIWQMNQLGDFETFWLARKVLRNAMVDQNIVKIFHDCRHDSIGLHEMLETCIVNVFDTSATETLIGQLQSYQKLWNQKNNEHPHPNQQKIVDKPREKLVALGKQIIAQCVNVRTPGLNDIYQRYQASHGINKNKEKYHKMWTKGDFSFFCKRPIDPEYRDYCIRDVLDLPEVYAKMLSKLEGSAQSLAYWISNQYAKQGFEALTQEKEEK